MSKTFDTVGFHFIIKQYPNETICLSEALFFIAKDGSTNTKAPVKQISPPIFLNGSLFSLLFFGSIPLPA